MILGQPWLATTDALIKCRLGEMTISNGNSVKKITLYPPSHPVAENISWLEDLYGNDNE